MAKYGTPKFTDEYISHVRERYLQSVEKMRKKKQKSGGKKKSTLKELKSVI